MNFDSRSFLLSVGCGLLTVLLSQSLLFSIFAVLPILYITLRLGNFSGFFTLIIAIAILSFLLPGGDALFFEHVLTSFLPAFLLGWLLNFYVIIENPEKTQETVSKVTYSNKAVANYLVSKDDKYGCYGKCFLSLPTIIFLVALILLVGYSFAVNFVFVDLELKKKLLDYSLLSFEQTDVLEKYLKETNRSKEELAVYTSKLVQSLYVISFGFSICLKMFLNLYFVRGFVPTTATGRSWPSLPANFRLPMVGKLFFLVSLFGLSLITKIELKLFFAASLGIFIAALLISGYASLHDIAQRKSWGKKLLLWSYICSIGFSFASQIIFAIMLPLATILQLISILSFLAIFTLGFFSKKRKVN